MRHFWQARALLLSLPRQSWWGFLMRKVMFFELNLFQAKKDMFFWLYIFYSQVRASVQGESLELPTESEAYTLSVKEEDGNLVVNIVADTYFGARQASVHHTDPIPSRIFFGVSGQGLASSNPAHFFLQTWSGDPVPARHLGSRLVFISPSNRSTGFRISDFFHTSQSSIFLSFLRLRTLPTFLTVEWCLTLPETSFPSLIS